MKSKMLKSKQLRCRAKTYTYFSSTSCVRVGPHYRGWSFGVTPWPYTSITVVFSTCVLTLSSFAWSIILRESSALGPTEPETTHTMTNWLRRMIYALLFLSNTACWVVFRMRSSGRPTVRLFLLYFILTTFFLSFLYTGQLFVHLVPCCTLPDCCKLHCIKKN